MSPESGKKTESNPSSLRKETSLHRSLKFRYAGDEGETETQVGAFVCDGRTAEGELIEVQCGSFGLLKEKLDVLTRKHKVRVIHPIIIKKYIELYDTEGCLLHRRKSPRKGSAWDVFHVLLYAPLLPLLKKLTIELAFVESVEIRTADNKGSWRRKGASITDRRLSAWFHSVVLAKPKDYYQFIPFKKNEQFTTRHLAEKAGINMPLARRTLYVLTKLKLAERKGKKGNTVLYTRV